MNETAAAIQDLITYLKHYEIRQTVGSDHAFMQFNQSQTQTKMRYEAALESGEDQDFVNALQSSPYPHQFVIEAMKGRI